MSASDELTKRYLEAASKADETERIAVEALKKALAEKMDVLTARRDLDQGTRPGNDRKLRSETVFLINSIHFANTTIRKALDTGWLRRTFG
jgi:hypothetical protein